MFSGLALVSPFRRCFSDRPVQHRRPTLSGRRRADRTRAQFQLEGLEDRCLLSNISGIAEISVPSVSSANDGITVGPDGNIWFTEESSNAIGEINSTTHAISSFPVPTANSLPWGITAGPDGNLWFTEKNADKTGMINPTTHAIAEFATPSLWPESIVAGPDGNIWFAEYAATKLGEINPRTHAISEFALPAGAAGPDGLTAGPDGNIWFNWVNNDEIGNINPSTHAITYFQVPAPNRIISNAGITAGPDGNIWFCDGTAVGVISPTTDAISFFSTSNIVPRGITPGPDGNLWFTTTSGQIGRINPTSDAITEYPDPGSTATNGITVGPDGNLWVTDTGVAVATLATTQFVVTQQPPSSVTAGSGFGVTVQAEDSSGNLDHLVQRTGHGWHSINPSGDTLGGTTTVTASGGVATFSGLTLTRAAIDTLYFSGGGYGWGVTSSITVTPASATQLVVTQQPPATVKVSTAFSMQALIEDAYGNVVTTASNAVSVAFANNPTGATLGGTLSVTASQGVASFTNLTINKTGSGYTLRVSGSGLTSAVSSPIKVTKTGRL